MNIKDVLIAFITPFFRDPEINIKNGKYILQGSMTIVNYAVHKAFTNATAKTNKLGFELRRTLSKQISLSFLGLVPSAGLGTDLD